MTGKKYIGLPPIAFVGITTAIMLIVGISVWQNTRHRPDIRGTWTSSCLETASSSGQKASKQKTYRLTRGEWSLEETFYSDQTCQMPAYTRLTRGTYELGDAAKEPIGAVHTEFGIASIALKPHSPETMQVFEQLKCGENDWQLDLEQEVGRRGCGSIANSVASCPIKFDIVKRNGDRLFFGSRSGSLCERYEWPNELDTIEYQKTP